MSDRSIRRMLALAAPLRKELVFGAVAGALTVGCGIALLAASGFLIARASEHPDEIALAVAVAAVRAFGVGRGAFRYVERLVTHDAALRALVDLRVRVWNRLIRVAPDGVGRFRSGEVLTRLVTDVDAIQDLLIRGVTPPVVAALVGSGTVIGLAVVAVPAAEILAAGLLAAAIAIPLFATRAAAKTAIASAHDRGELATRTTDLVDGCPELVAFGADRNALTQLAEVDARLVGGTRKWAWVTGLSTGMTGLVTGATVWGLLAAAIAMQAHGSLDRVGVAVVVLTGLAAFEATAPLAGAAQQLASVRAGSRRVLDLLDAPDAVADRVDPQPLQLGSAGVHLTLIGARLRYSPEGPWALDGVDLEVLPGKRVALVGASGSGKSTVARVLMRMRYLDEGEVLLNGMPIDQFAIDDVRRTIGGCLADAYVFDSTVRENLRLAKPDATEDELVEVARRVRLLDWIQSQPNGWDTSVGAHGTALSGGERQRLALARALLADFPVLVLDEPTAHLDPDTRDEVLADLLEATRGRTMLLITHDPTGLDQLDHVIRLDAGKVV